MKLTNSAKKGFTLVELLITVVIIGILAAVLLPKFSNNSDKARDTANLASLKSLDTAIDVYRIDGDQTKIVDWFSGDGLLTPTEKEAMLGDLQAEGKIVLNGLPSVQAAKFEAYATVVNGALQSISVMQYRDSVKDPHVVNANKTLSATFGTAATSATDFEGMSETVAAAADGSIAWPY